MKVKIIQSEKNFRELEIYIDEMLFRTVSKYFFKNHLSSLKHSTQPQKDFYEIEKKVAYSYALALLTNKDYTTLELRVKLGLKFSPQAIPFALEKLKPYLRDDELIKRQIAKEIKSGSGIKKILFKIKKRSDLPQEHVMTWIQEAYPREVQEENARALIQARFKHLDPKVRQKAYRFLLSRGFSYEIASAVLRG